MESNTRASQQVAALVLAAGMSQRMGRLKPLLPFGDRPMLARVLECVQAVESISPILVVTGHRAQEIEHAVQDYNVIWTHNAGYADGMLSSVQCGIQALPKQGDAFFLLLGDQPGVHPDTLRALLQTWMATHAPIVLPTYEGKRGHPILLSAHLIPEILALPPEATLKTVVERHSMATQQVAVADPAILMDVDTPEDYQRALSAFSFIEEYHNIEGCHPTSRPHVS